MPRAHFWYLTAFVSSIAALSCGFYFYKEPIVDAAYSTIPNTVEQASPLVHEGKYVLIHLDTEMLELKDGANTLTTMSLVSQGKPGSYYETIGGSYTSDYKELSHFSSIGHVYMPHSVHLFGNYFIHGIPYYPDGTRVSSAYSGGCIRLADEDAAKVYDFVTKGMPIIITRTTEYAFSPTATSTETITSADMTAQMAAIISLEVLTQDNEITDTDGISTTTRRKLLPELLSGNTDIGVLYSNAVGRGAFIDYMNQKAKTLGLTNTMFTGVATPATTTAEDQTRFMEYIATYKSYLTKASTK